MFSLASMVVSALGSTPVKKAYEKGRSIWDAKDELDKLIETIRTIQYFLRDAEKKKESSDAVKALIERVTDVLYDADDLFDEVATDELLKKQIKGDKPLKKVRAYCFKLNPIVSKNSIANQVKAIRKSLLEIYNDMQAFNLVSSLYEQPISDPRKANDLGSYVDSNDVIGRDNDKKTIIELLLDDNGEKDVSVIAIVGIGGMGKTTLAQLVYNDKEVENRFANRWFACISDTTNNTEIIGKLFNSVCEENHGDFTLSQLQKKIRKSVEGVKFLLVLDDVWDDNCANWQQHRMSLLRGGAKGSKIIVTTRSESVAKAVGALKDQTHNLEGLSKREAWHLFKKIAFTSEQDHEKDLRWANIGREIVKKCANVPLVIRSIASLLCTKDTIEEWELFKDIELSKVDLSGDPVMQTLKLSYHHLPSNLKSCFAYCSVFPKDHIFSMDELIYLWIAHGYIKPEKQTVEQVGYSYFMDLHRRYFFQKWERGVYKKEYKMHDLIHDLAQCVAGEEIIALTKPPNQLNERARHVSVGPGIDIAHMLNTNRLRSLFFLSRMFEHEDPQFTYVNVGKCLRALNLSCVRIRNVSNSIGELKHLRYLNMSNNLFESLPDSLTSLLNLLTLDISYCINLKALPNSFRKLINLRHLNTTACRGLKHMPPGMGELNFLQNLSCFKVGKDINERVQMSGIDVLARLQLRGELKIEFEDGIDNWDGDECWKLPVFLEGLIILLYPGRRIPHWSNHPSLIHSLSRLVLIHCHKVKYLPLLRCLPNLKYLRLVGLEELEYIEEEGEEDNICTIVAAGYINNNASFFPRLEELSMDQLPRLKGWSRRKVEATTKSSESASPVLSLSFPLLSKLHIKYCKELSSFPLCPCVRKLEIEKVEVGLMQQFLSTASTSTSPSSLEKLSIDSSSSPLLEDLKISHCNGLTSVEIEALPYLASLEIKGCAQLNSLHIARLNVLRELTVFQCPKELKLWETQQEKSCVDWDSLPNLRLLEVDRPPSYQELPNCLRRRHAHGQLQIPQPNEGTQSWSCRDYDESRVGAVGDTTREDRVSTPADIYFEEVRASDR